MTPQRTLDVLLNEEFLPLRARILEIAAGLDRLDRAADGANADPRRERLEQAIRLLLEEEPNRAEQVQRLFSREYDQQWRERFGLK
jgi:hypothetical protein